MTTERSMTVLPAGGVTERNDYAGQSMTVSRETATASAAAHVEALVKAKFVMALQRPRDIDSYRQAVLKECKRPRFAEVARYSKPVGGQRIEGASIRFAEAAARCFGNLDIATPTLYEDNEKRIVRCMVTDLEANLTHSKDVTITKQVERNSVKPGQVVLGQRTNSRGGIAYLVEATDDDLQNKEGSLTSKALRKLILKVIPGDITDECMDAVVETLKSADAQDPDAARKRLADAFASEGVTPAMLAKYLEHDLGSCSRDEIQHLRELYAAIKTGETTWHNATAKTPEGEPPPKGPAGVKEALKRKKAEPAQDAPAAEERTPGADG
jgi:hypothetical protein